MKGGQQVIHIQRWAPSDFVNDPAVKVQLARRDYEAITFYVLVLNHSFMEGGDLPSDAEALAAIISMPVEVVRRAMQVWIDAGKLFVEDSCFYNPRVRREVAREVKFRKKQKRAGREGGKASARKRALKQVVDQVVDQPLNDRSSPPSPTPAPSALRQAPAPSAEGLASLQAEAQRALNAAHEATGRPRDELLVEASSTSRGNAITRLDTCLSPQWLQTTTQKLTAIRLKANAQARTTPAELPTPDQWAANRGRR